MSITSIRFISYKAFKNYSVSLQSMNLLVGPNNSGKSTILSALRILEQALKIARTRAATRIQTPDGWAYGHQIAESTLPSSIENVHNDYSDSDSKIEFNITSKKRLNLLFPRDGGCILYWNNEGKPVISPTSFKQHFPVSIKAVPVLGPLEQEEDLVIDDTLRRASGTPRASRYFRNYWHKNRENFDNFNSLIESTWPGLSIKPPELHPPNRRLVMFFSEGRLDRELYWAGFGFQIWCQLLTHIATCNESDWLVIDEPEVYLHPDVQRQLLSILRSIQPKVIIATHSIEILGEADPAEILIVDKTKNSARRLKDIEGIQQALTSLGSVHNITLTQLARTRKIIFTEGTNDYKIIRRFAGILGMTELASGTDLTALESGGFSSWEKIKALSWGIKTTLGANIRISAVYDRDYWCDEKISSIKDQLCSTLNFAHIHGRKEIENYLLIPDVLVRAITSALKEKERNSGPAQAHEVQIVEILEQCSTEVKTDAQGQYIAKYIDHFRSSGRDVSTLTTEAIRIFDLRWSSLATRLEIIPGKDVLRLFRERVNEIFGVSISDVRILSEFKKLDIPDDMLGLLTNLENYHLEII